MALYTFIKQKGSVSVGKVADLSIGEAARLEEEGYVEPYKKPKVSKKPTQGEE